MNDLQYGGNGVKIVDYATIEEVIGESIRSPRKRASLCLHTDKSDLIQRMVMALQPGTYIRAHKHENPDKRESFTVYRGKIVVVIFTDDGDILKGYPLGLGRIRTIEIKPRVYHCLIALERDSVVFEVKDGPWESVEKDKTFAPWMPPEDSEEAAEYLRMLEERVRDDILNR